MEIIRSVDEAMVKRLLKKGAHIMAEYDFREAASDHLRQQGRWWLLQVPASVLVLDRATTRSRKVA